MSQIDQLLTIAEISFALAGFAGVIATFQFRQQERVTRGQVVSLSMIVNISLAGAFFAALPIGLLNAGLKEAEVWAITSGLLGVNQLLFVGWLARTATLRAVQVGVRVLYVLFFVIGTLIGFVDLMNAFGIVFSGGFGPIFFTFLLNFALVGFTFSRLLMYPLWRSLKRRAPSE